MTEKKLKERLGGSLVAAHFFLLGLLFAAYLAGGFRYDEFTTAFAIILPMFAGYTMAVTTYFRENRYKAADASKDVSTVFVALAGLFPALLFFGLALSISLYALGVAFESFENFKGSLALLESALAIYIGSFVSTMFKNDVPVRSERPSQPEQTGL